MDISKKLQILSDAAKYDVSCSSSGSKRKNTKNGIGNAASNGICHTFTSDGRCVSLLKILMTNCCIYDCSYCINKKLVMLIVQYLHLMKYETKLLIFIKETK